MRCKVSVTALKCVVRNWMDSYTTHKSAFTSQGLTLGCCAAPAGNFGNMLFIIIPAVCKEKGRPFGAPDVRHTRFHFLSSTSKHLKILDEKMTLKKLFAPSTIGAIVGFIVGVLPQI